MITIRLEPSRLRSLLKWFGYGVAIWSGLYLLLVLPFVAIYKHNLDKRPVVAASVSDHRFAIKRGPKSRGERVIIGTVSFKRWAGDHWTNCRLENYELGYAADVNAMRRTMLLAPHPLSCSDPVEMPLANYWLLHMLVFFGVIAMYAFVLIGHGFSPQPRANGRRQSAAA